MLGVLDSSLGGLTVVSQILARYPQAALTYIGDTARVPWGNKHPETIRQYSRQLTHFLVSRGATEIVVACHTASSVALNEIKEEARGLRIYEMISPSCRQAVDVTRNNNIGVIGTRVTVDSQSWPNAIKKLNHKIYTHSIACPLFVPIVEENLEDHPGTRQFVSYYLTPFLSVGIDTLILACTHYPYLTTQIGEFLGPAIKLVNPAQSVAQSIRPPQSGGLDIFFTDRPPDHSHMLKLLEVRPDATIKTVKLNIEHE